MKSYKTIKKYLFLSISILILFALTQCKDTVNQPSTKDTTVGNIESKHNSKSGLKAPRLISPQDDTTGVSLKPDFKWESVPGAKKYTLRVIHGEKTIIDQKVDSTSFTPPENLNTQTSYYWRVQSESVNKKGEWSDINSFTTIALPDAPEVISPVDDATEIPTQPTFKWKAVEGAEQYLLHVDDGTEPLIVDQKVEGTSFTPSESFKGETTHYWRMKALTEDTSGAWTKVRSFTTKQEEVSEPLSAPVQLSPADNATGTELQPTFEWEAVEGAEQYLLHVDDGTEPLIIDQKIEGTSFTPPENFKEETTHYWRVQAISGEEVAWSEVQSFTTKKEVSEPLSAPVQLTPKNDATDVALQPSFEWEQVEGADSYLLHVDDGTEPLVIDQNIEGTSFIPSEKLTGKTTHYWRVQAISGEETAWSEVQSFTTKEEVIEPLPAPSLLSPADNAVDVSTQTTLEWEAIGGADGYLVHLDDGTNSELIIDQQIEGNSLTTKILEGETTHYWRVRAVQDGVTGNWSEINSFTTVKETVNEEEPAASDRQALMDLYSSTGGDYWTSNSGWGSSDPLGSWHGIETDANGRVVRIDLFKNNLSGTLPASIGSLDKVRYLNVKNNYLTGSIPPEIGGMSSLETLILQGRTYNIGGTLKEPPSNWNYGYHPGKYLSNTNDFSGQIPSTIGNLSNLIILEISNAPNITGPLPPELGNLTNLKGLYINNADLSGSTIPDSFSNLTELRHFYLSGSDIGGQFPDISGWTKMTSLQVVSTSAHDDLGMTGPLPDLSHMTNLRNLVLSKNDFTGEFPKYLTNGNYEMIHTISLAWNWTITGTLPDNFSGTPYLKYLGVSGNEMTGDIQSLTTLPSNIRIISIGWNEFSGDFPQGPWPDFTQVKTVYLNDNNLTGSIPCSFWEKIDNPKLNIIWVGGTNTFDDTCPSGEDALVGNGSVNE